MTNSNITTYSYSQPIWQLILLFFCTMGIYQYSWFYRNYKQIYSHNNVEISPVPRTIGILIPLLGLFFIWNQLSGIKQFADQKEITTYKSAFWMTILFFICGSIGEGIPASMPDHAVSLKIFLWMILSPLMLMPFIIIQKRLNRYWKKEQANLPIRNNLRWLEIIICSICMLFILFILMVL